MKNYKGLNSRITPPKREKKDKIKPGKGLCEQISAPTYYSMLEFNNKFLLKLLRQIDGTSKRNRRTALAINRKKRWSKEVRDKILDKKKLEYLLKTKELLSQDKI